MSFADPNEHLSNAILSAFKLAEQEWNSEYSRIIYLIKSPK